MPSRASAVVAVTCLAIALGAPARLGAADPTVRLIVHPRRAAQLTEAEVRAIYLKQKQFWSDGSPIIAINREAGSAARELFSKRVFGQDSRRAATYWNQRYYE